jgi:hypothetical protein
MAETWRARLDAWKDFGVEMEEYRELDAERVLADLGLPSEFVAAHT